MTIKHASVDEFACCGKTVLRAVHDTERREVYAEIDGETVAVPVETTLVEQAASLLVDGEWICMDCAKERGLLE